VYIPINTGTFSETKILLVPVLVAERRIVAPLIFINTLDKSVHELVKYPVNPEDIYNKYC